MISVRSSLGTERPALTFHDGGSTGASIPFGELRARTATVGMGDVPPAWRDDTVVECAVRYEKRCGIAEAARTHASVVGVVVDALLEHGVILEATLFGVTPVAPGRRARDMPAPYDVALANVRSLRTAGAVRMGAFAFRPADGHEAGIVARPP